LTGIAKTGAGRMPRVTSCRQASKMTVTTVHLINAWTSFAATKFELIFCELHLRITFERAR
jgi:hypothetical protein